MNTSFDITQYQPHPSGKYGLNGINTLGCHSTIMWNDKVWHFSSFNVGSSDFCNDEVRYINYIGCDGIRTFNKMEVMSSVRLC